MAPGSRPQPRRPRAGQSFPAAAALVLLLLARPCLAAGGGCVEVLYAVVERPDAYALQANTLSFALEARCNGTRDVGLHVGVGDRFVLLDPPPARLRLDGFERHSVRFYPAAATAGNTFIPVVATDLTDPANAMSGTKAILYVANPLAQWWYAAGLAAIAAALLARRRGIDALETSPLPLALGAWLVYRGYYLATRQDVWSRALERGILGPEAVWCAQLVLAGAFLAAFGRTAERALRRERLALALVVAVFACVFPPGLYLPDELGAAWRVRSPAPLAGWLALLLAPPLVALSEVARLHPLAAIPPALVALAAAPPTVLYWRAVARWLRRSVGWRPPGS